MMARAWYLLAALWALFLVAVIVVDNDNTIGPWIVAFAPFAVPTATRLAWRWIRAARRGRGALIYRRMRQ